MGPDTTTSTRVRDIVTNLGLRQSNVLPLLSFVLIGGLILTLYQEVLRHLFEQWVRDPNYSYGLFVPPFCGWTIWQRRRSLQAIVWRPVASGFAIITGALGMLTLGVFGAEVYLSRVSFLFLIAGLVVYFYGWQMFRAVLFPWSVLILAVPLPTIIFNEVALPLQFEASRLASALVGWAGVPVLREGNILVLPSLTLDVAEACSGLRSLMSLITLAVFYGCIFESRVYRRWLLMLAAIPIAVVANAVRIMGSGLLGEYWGPDKAEGFFHLFSGGLIFACSLMLLFAFHAAVKWVGRVVEAQAS
jgi:exosortase